MVDTKSQVVAKQLKTGSLATPFVKWAGGKGQLLLQYEPLFPITINDYFEPFVGGGAVFFFLHSQGRLGGKAALSDFNEELMNCYRVIRDRAEELVEKLWEHDAQKMDKDYYYKVRKWDRDGRIERKSAVERAARTMFLNKTCYNGLYRVNSKGQFNVPYGRYKNPTVCDESNLRAVSQALQGVELDTEDFEKCLERAKAGDFVYFDPPYHPLSATSSFTSYTKEDFGEEEQRRLARVFQELDERGCKVMLSNSDTPLVWDLYQDYRIGVVTSNRSVSGKPSTRKGISEMVILNY